MPLYPHYSHYGDSAADLGAASAGPEHGPEVPDGAGGRPGLLAHPHGPAAVALAVAFGACVVSCCWGFLSIAQLSRSRRRREKQFSDALWEESMGAEPDSDWDTDAEGLGWEGDEHSPRAVRKNGRRQRDERYARVTVVEV